MSQAHASDGSGGNHGKTRQQALRFDPAASAAAGAVMLVMFGQAYHTLGSERWLVWIDALVNEWLIWFTVLYLIEVAILGVRARLAGGKLLAFLQQEPSREPGA
jgi:hypothetical protein